MPPPITLTTDFGPASPYVAAMKGAILTVNPIAPLHDLSHSIPPQNVAHAAHFLAAAVPYFPADTIHLCVVDPGVGTDRAALLAEARGQYLIGPDNGCLAAALDALGEPTVRRLENPKFWRTSVSPTFHGRDIFGPVAGHLSRGIAADRFGPETDDWVRLDLPAAERDGPTVRGAVAFVDDFGNLITNIPAELVPERPRQFVVGKTARKKFAWVRTYGEAKPGELALLISSDGRLEIAVPHGSAAAMLKAGVGTPVSVGFAG